MRKLIIEEWISLDGYVADKEGRLDFFTKLVRDTYTDDSRKQFLETIDSLLMGRKTYELFESLWPDRPTANDLLAEKINTTEKIVVSGTLADAPWGKWEKARVIPGDPVNTVKTLKDGSGKNIVLWGSISLAQELAKHGLVDEYHFHICPTLTAGGRKLFTEVQNQLPLQLVATKTFTTGIVLLQYQTT